MRWTGHVENMERGEAYTGFWLGNVGETDYMEVPGLDGRIIIGWMFWKWDVWVWNGSSWLRIGTVGGQL
jgi:hypothetical protein